MKITDIKRSMRVWYKNYYYKGDDSYLELYNALKTMRSAGLISDDTWGKIYDYDRELFQEFNG